MKSRDFIYWIQGFFEICKAGGSSPTLNQAQVEIIQKHLNMVFYHEIDLSFPDSEELNKIHGGELKKIDPYEPIEKREEKEMLKKLREIDLRPNPKINC